MIDKSEFVMSLFEQLDRGRLGPQEKSIVDRCMPLVYKDYRAAPAARTYRVMRVPSRLGVQTSSLSSCLLVYHPLRVSTRSIGSNAMLLAKLLEQIAYVLLSLFIPHVLGKCV